MRGARRSIGHSAAGAMTIRELVFMRMVVEIIKYLQMREIRFADSTELDQRNHLKVQRGIIRGIALAMTKMYGNGYEPYWTREIKDAEKAAHTLAREFIRGECIRDGQPGDDEWWLSRRERFWRSQYDQSGAGV